MDPPGSRFTTSDLHLQSLRLTVFQRARQAMSNRRLEVFHYRQALQQMQQGMSDRAIALGGTMGRRKAAQLRCRATAEGLSPAQ